MWIKAADSAKMMHMQPAAVKIDLSLGALDRYYRSDHAAAGLVRSVWHLAATPFRCVYLVYRTFEQLLYVSYVSPWPRKPQAIATVINLAINSLLMEGARFFQPFWVGSCCVQYLANRPAFGFGSPFGLGKHSPFAYRQAFSWTDPVKPSKPLDYDIVGGHCWGISLHFVELLYRLKDKLKNPEDRLYVAARYLRFGAPARAQFLQALGATHLKPKKWEYGIRLGFLPLQLALLTLRMLGSFSRFFQDRFREDLEQRIRTVAVLRHDADLLPFANLAACSTRHLSQVEELAACPSGIYLVRQGFENAHEMVYVKLSSFLSYTMDPNWGLSRHAGIDQAKKAARQLGLTGSQGLRFTRVSRRTFIDWPPFNLRFRFASLLV